MKLEWERIENVKDIVLSYIISTLIHIIYNFIFINFKIYNLCKDTHNKKI